MALASLGLSMWTRLTLNLPASASGVLLPYLAKIRLISMRLCWKEAADGNKHKIAVKMSNLDFMSGKSTELFSELFLKHRRTIKPPSVSSVVNQKAELNRILNISI